MIKTLLIALTLLSTATYADLRIMHLDVGQADSTLIISPSGHSLLIDTGGNGAGEAICIAAESAGITQIDVLITTHYHLDHFGGIDDLSDCGLEILKAYDRGD